MIVFSPGLRNFLSPAFGCTIVILAAIVALVYFGNIFMVLYYMYTGYGPEAKELDEVRRTKMRLARAGSNPREPHDAAPECELIARSSRRRDHIVRKWFW